LESGADLLQTLLELLRYTSLPDQASAEREAEWNGRPGAAATEWQARADVLEILADCRNVLAPEGQGDNPSATASLT
jgi:hypothetical protein